MRRRIFANLPLVVVAVLVSACSATSTTPIAKRDIPRSNDLRVADCDGPPTSLPSDLRAQLGPRTGQMIPDDHWADLAQRIPGGFAGILYSEGKPVLMLTRPEEAAAAKIALESDATFNGFDVAHAEVRKVRWDFAQLVDWYRYLVGPASVWITPGMVSGDKDEALNRIRFGVETEAGRQELKQKILAAHVPCDLVAISLQSRVTF